MIITVQNTERYFDFISTIVEGDYRFKYLNSAMTGIFNQVVEVGTSSYIHDEAGGWLIYLETKGHLFIYGDNCTNVHISHFIQTINFKKRQGWEIMGTRDLVYTLLEQSGINNYKLIKDRYFYESTTFDPNLREDNIETAEVEEIEELTEMFQSYYIEEYNGERNKPADYLRPTITRMIEEDSLYVIKSGKNVAAFCSILNPDIGIIFTKEMYRGQGLGYRLLEYCTSILIEENGIAYIMTDMHNPASNIICRKIGYQVIYEHTNLKLPSNFP